MPDVFNDPDEAATLDRLHKAGQRARDPRVQLAKRKAASRERMRQIDRELWARIASR